MRPQAGWICVVGLLVILVAYAASAGPACSASIHLPMRASASGASTGDCGCGDQTGPDAPQVSGHCSSCATAALSSLPLIPQVTGAMSVISLSLPNPIHVASRLDRPPQA